MPRYTQPDLSIIIINYKTPKLTSACLESVYRSKTKYSFEVIVFDNNSQDHSKEILIKYFPEIIFLGSKQNQGFGKGNNLAARSAQGEYLLLLNSDTVLAEDTIEKMLTRIRADQKIGVLGPRLINPDRSLQRSVFRFPGWSLFLAEALFWPNLKLYDDYRNFKHDREKYVDFVSGACLLLKKKVFIDCGGFDEDFFMYAEETDLCKKIKERGYKILFYPGTQIVHVGGASGAKDNTPQILESKAIFIHKHCRFYRLLLLLLVFINLERYWLSKTDQKKYGNLIDFYWDLYKNKK